jgi:flagellar biosynthesis/type III secretory pathway protein FliH
MATIIASLGRDERTRSLLSQLYVYLLRATQPDVELDAVRTILLQVAGPQGQEDVVNAAEQLIEQGRAEGLQKGRAEGLQKGRAEGLQKGRAEGLRSAIATALSSRAVVLSELGDARLAACTDVDVLKRWLTRAITAAAEAEIFADEAR